MDQSVICSGRRGYGRGGKPLSEFFGCYDWCAYLASIRQSPIELFYQKLDEEIKEDDKVAIYLATDSEEVKREMKERYGDRIFCSGKKADRGSLEGIREGITDMYTLARTQKIYGSFQSSFSNIAAQLGRVR